jgi:hypothetical protein
MYDLSVFLPTIRVHLLDDWYSSLEESCDRHSFEVVLCGPFSPSDNLLGRDNVTWTKSFASPTVCAQQALLACKGKCVYHTVDDVTFFKGVISDELDTLIDFNVDVMAMRYREGEGYAGDELPAQYWQCKTAYAGWPGVRPEWLHCVHFMMETNKCIGYGGFDCRYQYLNHATHDLLFRMYKTGRVAHLSQSEVCSADWQPGTTGDHAPIHHAQIGHDAPLFQQEWGFGNNRCVVDINNWQQQPEVWNQRFSGKEKSYADLN